MGRGRPRRAHLPGIGSDVVVIAIGSEEQGPGIVADRDIQAELARVKALCGRKVGHAQMHVSQPRACGQSGRFFAG